MAAGYISSTSGIGVAEPYDAGLYEAQQDALNRIDRQKQIDLQEQKQKFDLIKATTSDLDKPTGIMPEHAETVIKPMMNDFTKLSSDYLRLASRNPTSPQAIAAREKMNMARNAYQTATVESKGVYDMVKSIEQDLAKNPNKYDADAVSQSIIDVRTAPFGTPKYYEAVQKLRAPAAPISSTEMAQAFVKSKDKNIETSMERNRFGDVIATQRKGLYNANPNEAYEDAAKILASDYRTKGQSIVSAISREFEEVVANQGSDFKYYQQKANELGTTPEAIYLGDRLKMFGSNQETVKKVGSDPFYKSFQSQLGKLKAGGFDDAEQLSADIVDLAAIFQGSPKFLKEVPENVRQQVASLPGGRIVKYRVPSLEGRIIGKTTQDVKTRDGVRTVEQNMIISQAFVGDDGKLLVYTSDGAVRRYDNMTQAMQIITYNKDGNKEAKNKTAAKELAKSMNALSNEVEFVSDKLYKLPKEEQEERQRLFGKTQPQKAAETPKSEPAKKKTTMATIKSKIGTKGYEGYTEQELIDYYKSQGYTIE